MIFHPIAASTPAHAIEYATCSTHEINENQKHLSTNHSFDINNLGSQINNQQHVSETALDTPQAILPSGAASDNILSIPETAVKEKTNETVQSGNSIKDKDERLNRMNFFLKNITTSLTCIDIFTSISRMYPLVQLNTTNNSSKIQYLCVAGNFPVNVKNIK